MGSDVLFFLRVSAILFIFLLIEGTFVLAINNPRQIHDCNAYSCVMTIPRDKFVMSKIDPNTMWVVFVNSASNNFIKTTDGGLTWTAADANFVIKPYIDMHSSLGIDERDNVYLADRCANQCSEPTYVYFRKVNAPANAPSQMNAPLNIAAPFPGAPPTVQTPNILVENSSSIFIILRRSNSPSNDDAQGNIWYLHSTNGGVSFGAPQQLFASGAEDVRIGSFLIGNIPAVILKYQSIVGSPNTDYQYFVWDTNQNKFVAPSDSIIVSGRAIGGERAFHMAYANGELHLAYNDGTNLMHAWKTYNNGQTTWSSSTLSTSSFSGADAWHPKFSRQNNTLYLVYAKPNPDVDHSDIMYRVWNKTAQSFGTEKVFLADHQANRFPQGPAIVHPNATAIPIVWNRGDSQTVWFDTIPLEGSTTLGPCEDGVCNAGDACPLLNSTCADTSCYEPTCNNGCGQTAVSFGQKDETCLGNNYCNGTGICTPCRTDLEMNCNGVIEDTELNNLIQQWYNDIISIGKLMEGIKYWKAGRIN